MGGLETQTHSNRLKCLTNWFAQFIYYKYKSRRAKQLIKKAGVNIDYKIQKLFSRDTGIKQESKITMWLYSAYKCDIYM